MSNLTLHTIHSKKGARRRAIRVGRGLARKGTFSGRGVKGQRARSGGRAGLKLKGLRHIMLSIPKKRGFRGPRRKPATVNVGDLAKYFSDGALVNAKTLQKKGLLVGASPVKILGDGAMGIKITVEGCAVSRVAKKKIEMAGGRIV